MSNVVAVCCRHNKTLARLLGRCARVHHVINGSDDDNGDDFSDTEPQQTRAQFELEAAAAVKHNRQQRGPATSFSSSRAAAGRLKPPDSRCVGHMCTTACAESQLRVPFVGLWLSSSRIADSQAVVHNNTLLCRCPKRSSSVHVLIVVANASQLGFALLMYALCSAASRTGAASSKANGSGGVSAPLTDADSKLLVRAAQRLLEDAQDDAHQGSRTLKEAAAGSAGAGAGAGRRAAGRASAGAGASSSNTGRRPAAAVAAVASVDDLRNSPLGSVLAQYKEAQAAWAQERVGVAISSAVCSVERARQHGCTCTCAVAWRCGVKVCGQYRAHFRGLLTTCSTAAQPETCSCAQHQHTALSSSPNCPREWHTANSCQALKLPQLPCWWCCFQPSAA